jgi:hypothetical protein
MAAAFAEIAIGGAGDLGLLAVDRLDDDAGARDQIVEAPAGPAAGRPEADPSSPFPINPGRAENPAKRP